MLITSAFRQSGAMMRDWMALFEMRTPVISIIDDDESVRVALRSLVRSLGFVAHTFGSAEEFLQSPYVDATSCLISDVRMPGMNGVELHEHLRAEGRQIPTILMTAFPDEHLNDRAARAGAVAFLIKPFDSDILARHMESVLRES